MGEKQVDSEGNEVEPMIQVRLIKGASFTTPFGVAWRKGQVMSFPKSRLPDYYRTNARFAINEAPVRLGVKQKSRSAVRRERHGVVDREPSAVVQSAPVESTPAPKAQPADGQVASKISDRSKLAGFTDKQLELAAVAATEDMKKEELIQLALQLGAASPEGVGPRKAKNKSELLGWIRLRQSQIIAQSRVGDDDEAPSDEDDEDEEEDDEEELDLDTDFEE